MKAEDLETCRICGRYFDARKRPDYSKLCINCDPPEKELPDPIAATKLSNAYVKKHKFNNQLL